MCGARHTVPLRKAQNDPTDVNTLDLRSQTFECRHKVWNALPSILPKNFPLETGIDRLTGVYDHDQRHVLFLTHQPLY